MTQLFNNLILLYLPDSCTSSLSSVSSIISRIDENIALCVHVDSVDLGYQPSTRYMNFKSLVGEEEGAFEFNISIECKDQHSMMVFKSMIAAAKKHMLLEVNK
jgi:hypothetical protein